MTKVFTSRSILVGSLLAATWAVTAWFFYAPAKPLASDEIDAYLHLLNRAANL